MIEPYINLNGQAGEAIEFYKSVFGCTDIKVFRLSDMPENPEQLLPPEMKNLVGDSELKICGTTVHISDMKSEGLANNGHISLMVHFDNANKINEIYKKLSETGEVLVEILPQPFAKLYGWIKDKYGVGWQLMWD